MAEHTDFDTDAAAYLLGALEPDEADAFQTHMTSCSACREEVATLSMAADALALAAPQQDVPRGLKRRVMADIRGDARAGAGRSRRRPQLSLGAVFSRPAFAAVAAVLVLAVVIGAWALGSGSPSSRVIQAEVTWHGSAALRLSGARGELVVKRMPAPPGGKVYEVWLQRGAGGVQATSALFDVSASGTADVIVPGNLHGVKVVMVTPERLGGSSIPTHAPVLVARV